MVVCHFHAEYRLDVLVAFGDKAAVGCPILAVPYAVG